MRQCNKSVISPIFVFFVTFVMIFNGVSGYKTTRHHDKHAVIEEDSESNEIEMNTSVFINRLLKSSPSALRSPDEQPHGFDELNQFPHASFSEHAYKPIVHNHPSTSCGQITCDSVPNYPEDIIIEVAKSSKLIPESPKIENEPKTKYPKARSLDFGDRQSTDYRLGDYPERVQDCSKLYQEIVVHPRESINENRQPKLLVNLPQYDFAISASVCRGPKECRDPTTPEHKIFKCETDYRPTIVEIFDPSSKRIERQKMIIPHGCKCGLRDA